MKTKKSVRKYAASGKLKQAIQARHKHQKVRKQIDGRKARKGGGKGRPNGKTSGLSKTSGENEEDKVEDVEMEEPRPAKKAGGKGGIESDNDEMQQDEDDMSGSDEDEGEDDDDDASFSSLDDEEEDDGVAHLQELSKLAEKDPEFYKYLQENDRELLDFKPNDTEVMLSDEEMQEGIPSDDEEEATPVLKPETLKGWQKALLEHRSLRALRKLLIAFRAAAYANDDDATVAWAIDNPSVFDKVVTTALKYTPVVLDHHIPSRALPNGRYKPPISSPKQQTLTRMISSFFKSIIHLLSQLTNPQMVTTCLTDSAKLIPYIVGNRKIVKSYLKTCLGFWSSPSLDVLAGDEEDGYRTGEEDRVRIAAFLSIRRVALGNDEALLDLVLKGTYTTLVRSSRATNVHLLPAINLMKNTAVDLYSIDPAASYQHAFGYIRQLAVTLRTTLKAKVTGPKDRTDDSKGKPKLKSNDPYKQVYNWQFVLCVDFWSMLLSRCCEKDSASELQPLIYPLVQVALGAVKLAPTTRYYPLHLNLLRALLTLSHNTRIYIPLPPYLLPIVASLISTQKLKSSTLKPLDLEHVIRAPTSYLKTRTFIDGMVDESLYLLAEWCADVQDSVAFPEIMVPVVAALKRCLKTAKKNSGKAGGKGGDGKSSKAIKTLVERIEEGIEWTKKKRLSVTFAPNDRVQVDQWESAVRIKDTPLGKYASILKKMRERNRAILQKAKQGEGEYLEQ